MLSRRWVQAQTQLELCKQCLVDLNATIDTARLEEWKALERKARAERHIDLSVMEVYEVVESKGSYRFFLPA